MYTRDDYAKDLKLAAESGRILDACAVADKYIKTLESIIESYKSGIADRRIKLTLRTQYIMDTLSINEWNALITSYENDELADVSGVEDEFVEIRTTLANVVNNHSILDLRFVSWIQELPSNQKMETCMCTKRKDRFVAISATLWLLINSVVYFVYDIESVAYSNAIFIIGYLLIILSPKLMKWFNEK